jgi:pimeloyl-ACP methyl ester carboxylesterase
MGVGLVFTEKTFKANEVEINYAVGPPNGPPLLVLHSLTGNWMSNQLLFPFLINHWQIYAPDFRYHGRSGRPKSKITIQNYAKDIIELIKEEIKTPVCIFGHSLGGLVSMMIASEIPSMVKCVINGDGGFNKKHIAKWIAPSAAIADILIKIIESSESKYDLFYYSAYAPMKLTPDGEPIPTLDAPNIDIGGLGITARSYKFLDSRVFSELKEVDELIKDYDAEDFLPKITCPVLLLRADINIDALMLDEDIELAKKHIKNLTYKKYKGIGHNLFHEDLFAVVNTIVHYLNMFLD